MSTLTLSHPPHRPQATAAPAASPRKPPRGSCTFRPEPVPLQELERLLRCLQPRHVPGCWGRAAPAADHWQEIATYALLPQGSFRFDPRTHALCEIDREDQRGTVNQHAPVVLVHVADDDVVQRAHAEEHGVPAGADAGCLVESIFQDAPACGMATALCGGIDRARLARALGLRPEQRIVVAQALGYAPAHTAH